MCIRDRSAAVHKIFIQAVCFLWLSRLNKTGAVALSAVGVKGKLADYQKFPAYIAQGAVG